VCWLVLGGAFVVVLGFTLFTILVKEPNARSTAPAEQPIVRNEDDHSAPKAKDPEDELLPAAPAPRTNDSLVRTDEIDRVLGGGFSHPAEQPAPSPAPVEDAPPLPPPPEARPPAPPEPTPQPPAPPKPNPKPKEPDPAPPAPPSAKPKTVNPDVAIEKRLQASESDLREQLLAVPELRLLSDLEVQSFREMEKNEERAARGAVRGQVDYAFNARLNQAMRQAGAKAGLPLQSGPNCRLDPTTATVVQTLSKDLRDLGFVSVPGVPGIQSFVRRRLRNGAAGNQPNVAVGADDLAKQKMKAFKDWCDENRVEKFRGTLATLLQMLQVEDAPTRLLLVRELDKVKSPSAAAVLAKRSVVDLSPEVREAAVAALQNRPTGQYVPVLMQALRYPWAPVADHAAAALRTLKPEGAVPKLVGLLDRPDPSVPVLDPKTRKQSVRELVRLNHMRNCLLCHAPSANDKDGLVRGLVPTPGQPLPRLYYAGQRGNFVRADTTFLRQDFSVNMPVEAATPWPKEQRFDFVTRVRTVKPNEMPEIAAKPGTSPQREAVVYALRGLTGKDGGDSADKWRDLLGIAKDKDATLDKTTKDKKPALDKQGPEKKTPFDKTEQAIPENVPPQ
jgi:hypothetical protein